MKNFAKVDMEAPELAGGVFDDYVIELFSKVVEVISLGCLFSVAGPVCAIFRPNSTAQFFLLNDT